MEIVDNILKKVEESDIVNGQVVIPEGVSIIGILAFQKLDKMTSVILPKSLRTIEELAFAECTSLKEVNLNEGLATIKYAAFSNCTSLRKVKMTDSVLSMEGNTFRGCGNLEEARLSENLSTIDTYTFHECRKLTTINFPKALERIEEGAFAGCSALKEVKLSENVTSIEKGAFSDCTNLTRIEISNRLERIGEEAFFNCASLIEANLKEGIKSIGSSTFAKCTNLESVSFPKTLQRIEKYAFFNSGLKNVDLKDNIKAIEQLAFNRCNSLKTITIPITLSTIGKDVFNECKHLEKLIIRGRQGEATSIDMKEESYYGITKEIITNYLYAYANSILKEKYENKREMLSNKNLSDICFGREMYSEDFLEKFRNVFYKTRKNYDIPSYLLYFLKIETTKDFSYSAWNEIKDAFIWRDNEPLAKSLAEMIEVFGLFKKDKNTRKRIEDFKDFFIEESYDIPESEFSKELYEDSDEAKNFYDKKTRTIYLLDNNVQIPEEFEMYLTNKLTEKVRKRIKKISGNYGKRLNDFITENYHENQEVVYELKECDSKKEKILGYLFQKNFSNHVNANFLHQVFDGCIAPFDSDFYNFFMNHLDFILANKKVQSQMKEIQKQFPQIKSYYLVQSGTTEITLKQALDYVKERNLEYQDGNYEFQKGAKIAGVTDQERFDFYQELLRQNEKRKKSSLVKRSNIYEIDGYILKAELLRKDDPFTMLVGETNYTNCCQRYHGMGHNCMAHAVGSDDGGIFVVRLLKDGEWMLLTESWDWQNNNLYCHDNIEGTTYLKEGPEKLRKVVAEVFRKDAESIIEKSKQEVKKYIEERRKQLERSFGPEKETELARLKDLEEREVIKVVTSGTGYDDLGLKKYFNSSISVGGSQLLEGKIFTLKNFQPVNYNSTKPYFDSNYLSYSDANETQYILAGSLEDLVLERQEELEPIYRDERRIVLESKNNIRNHTVKKVKDIELAVLKGKMKSYLENKKEYLKDSHIYYGEDWYLIYQEGEDNTIFISELAKVTPSIEDERGIQNQEIMGVIYDLIRKYDMIQADLPEDVIYQLYLINKHLNYIEQVGEDISYSLDDRNFTKVVSKEEQEEILKKQEKLVNSNQLMHRVTFKKGKMFVKEQLQEEIPNRK